MEHEGRGDREEQGTGFSPTFPNFLFKHLVQAGRSFDFIHEIRVICGQGMPVPRFGRGVGQRPDLRANAGGRLAVHFPVAAGCNSK
ncbi:MAG: hypothetical protein HZA93_18350 [Verrucomicrobia bacterium]|nr:hypothetical protein [Verrucomicrobiota bacterium]